MKKIITLIGIVFVFSCSTNEDILENTSSEESNFLLSKMITHYDNDEVVGEDILSYTYNSANNPISLNYESLSGEISQVLEFVYDDSGELTEIVYPIENPNGFSTYKKAVVQTFNENQAILIVQRFDSEDVLIGPLYEVRFEFEGLLIKSLLTIPDPSYASGQIYTNFTHDDDGKLLHISNGAVGSEPYEYQVLSWDDNIIPDTVNYFSRSFFDIKYWFPKHYISTKNPTMVFHANEAFNIMVDYESDSENGTVSNYIVSDDSTNPDSFDYSENVSKLYIEAN
ncbi:hypothetical protein ACFO3O_17690 [Dokdonia ponticola]|uniref:DUF4595 domain-containing protein n=1 Tax=Dokdonia ponticola TaxID=2041041 RepID=A0ABV9HZZ8_9FLAO